MKNILRVFILIMSLAALTGCALFTKNLKDPQVKFVDLSISDFASDTVSLDLKLNVKNPNDVDLEVNKITYGLAVSGKPATEGVFAEGAKVEANGESDLIIPLRFKYSTLGDILKSLVSNDLTKEYELKGAVDLGFISIPFTKKGEIKLK